MKRATRALAFAMLALAGALLAPAASAGVNECAVTPAGQACAYDGVYQSGCYEGDLTYADVYLLRAVDVFFNGYHNDLCGTPMDGVAVGGSVTVPGQTSPGVYAGVIWYGLGGQCQYLAYTWVPPLTGQQFVVQDCAGGVAPPNPGWGHLVPR